MQHRLLVAVIAAAAAAETWIVNGRVVGISDGVGQVADVAQALLLD